MCVIHLNFYVYAILVGGGAARCGSEADDSVARMIPPRANESSSAASYSRRLGWLAAPWDGVGEDGGGAWRRPHPSTRIDKKRWGSRVGGGGEMSGSHQK